MTKTGDTAQEIAALYATIVARKTADPADSYSAQLLADLPRAARKIGEEASETMVAALSGSDEELLAEAGDLLFHLLVVLVARGLTLDQLTEVLAQRAGTSGIAEKAARDA
jgi:phosphoribosyl-ATP pyrophosphohydrolase